MSLRRWSVLLTLLGGSAWLLMSSPAGPVDVVEAAPRARRTPEAPAARLVAPPAAGQGTGSFVAALTHRGAAADDTFAESRPMLADPFAPRDWAPKPKVVLVPAAAPTAPTAPALPFGYLGKQRVDGLWEVFLSRGDQALIVREGQTFDGDNYRVESIRPPTLLLTYLPLAQQQTLAIGAEE